MKKCIKCGVALKDTAKFCDECGTEQTNEIVEQSNLSINNKNERAEDTTFNEIINEANEIVNKTQNKKKAIIAIIILAILILSFIIIIVCKDRKPENMTQKVYNIGIDLLEDVDLCLEQKMSIDRLITKINSAYDNIAEYRQSDAYPSSGDTLGDFSLEMLCFRMIPNEFRTDQPEIELYQVEKFRDELKEKLGK